MTFKRFVNLFQYLVLTCAAVAVVLLLTYHSPVKSQATRATPTSSESVNGAELYAANCSSCHGSDGSGGFGPKLSGGAVVSAFPNQADQERLVAEGKGSMPAWKNSLSKEEITAVVLYTRSLP